MLAVLCAAGHAAPPADAEALNVNSVADLQTQVHALVQRGAESAKRKVQVDDAGRWGLAGQLPATVRVSLREKVLNAHTRQVEVQVHGVEGDAPVLGSLRFVLRDLQTVWVSSLPQRKGATLACDQLHQESRVIRAGAATWRGSCEGLKDLRVRRAVQAGDVLLAADLAPVAAVSANEEANASISVGAVRIEVRATALADGQVGQEIPIRLAGQSGVLRARVQAPGEVIVVKGL